MERLNAFFRTATELQKRLEVLWKPDTSVNDEAARADALRREVSAFYADAVAYGAGDGCDTGAGGSCGTGGASGCCGSSSGCCSSGGTAGIAGYDARAFLKLPAGVQSTTFGCGDPVSMAELSPGQTVLDLGCGAGLDLLLAADKVGPAGRVIGVDMTERMLEQARRNVEASGFANIELRQGTIEALPVEDASVDWVVSNCVINLSPEKSRVFAELARVLRPGGRVRISDITAEDLPGWARNSLHLYASCVAGALPVQEFLDGLTRAGLEDARALSMHIYTSAELESLLGSLPAPTGDDDDCEEGCGCNTAFGATFRQRLIASITGQIATVTFTARKPD
jgi:ubiquinone/menaquinone biosynthesis C-methylase UbiE